MGRNLLKKGDKVVMHTCIEAEKYNGKIWTCRNDEYVKGEGVYKQNLVFLEGFSGCFSTEYLQKIDINNVYCKNMDCVYQESGKCNLSTIKKKECLSIDEYGQCLSFSDNEEDLD